ncbi:hypothetical protein NLM33_06395 [Bradyrhizobium sp. CCGUVB1N3]|uniref:hypothetical protein n=1 Tax=Bradyrhizobium sp. CCGUVB1N3 TaxID=2949629 RepID=UPI0020B39EAF|nr:hypothetical protein [Bradyrhizobium sp. CCGUVB1N3]MCP3469958.1 hypothetical protein [Bradyrhizobium sp. CCGUVB1N3]
MADPKCTTEPEITPWPDRIRRTGELKIFPGPSFTASVWVNDLDPAITTINRLLKQSGINLAFKKADKESGSPIIAEIYPGSGLHGSAALTVVDSSRGTSMGSVKLRVPATPKIGQVDVGKPVRLHILVHELVHCIGLSNCAHSNDDVFIARPVISVGATQGGKVLPLDGSGSIPPPKLGAHTIEKIKKAWPET